MVFTTLLFRAELSSKERARTNSLVSPRYRVNSTEQTKMVERAEWSLVEQRDVTAEYAKTVQRNLRAYEFRAPLAARVLSETEFNARMKRKRNYLKGIEDGLLRRSLFVTVTRD